MSTAPSPTSPAELAKKHNTPKSRRTDDDITNAVVTDYELEKGEHPIGSLVHISSVTHAWRGVLIAVTPSYYILDNNRPFALVDSTQEMGKYLANPTAGSPGDAFTPKEGTKSKPTIRVPRSAVAWIISWEC